jgi:MinD superfamily P-loop ATPase
MTRIYIRDKQVVVVDIDIEEHNLNLLIRIS